MRGKVAGSVIIGVLLGITPAYAGKRPGWADSGCQRGDHPRVCGEKARLGRFWLSAWGSPLRVRGKAGLSHGCLVLVGITPARAGKSVSRRPRWTHTGDHPRVCGEKLFQSPLLRSVRGSPPRVRGKGNDVGCLRQVHGITPAHAGKSAVKRSSASLSKDHPRVCGEKELNSTEQLRLWGSPPRMRGKEQTVPG